MFRDALPRLLTFAAVVLGAPAALGAALGALAGKSVLHSIAIGYYVVGAAVLVGCFVVGSRGPVRREPAGDEELPIAAPSLFGSPGGMFRRRSVRRTTPEERREAKLSSLGLFVVAIALIILGAAVDPARRAF